MQFGFLLYDSRSGSTLFSSLLNQYKGVRVSLETGFATRVYDYDKPVTDSEELRLLLNHLFEEKHISEAGVTKDGLLNRLTLPLESSECISQITMELFEDDHDNFKLIKHPPYFHLNRLINDFPQIKFIFLVRDGRDVHLSKTKTTSTSGKKMSTNIIRSALKWRKSIRLTSGFGDRMYIVRYEDLVDDTDTTMRGVLKFLGIEKVEKVRSADEYASSIGNSQKKLHENLGKPVMASNKAKWATELTEEEIFVYQKLAGNGLALFKYPLQKFNGSISFYWRVAKLLLGQLSVYVTEAISGVLLSIKSGTFFLRMKKKIA